MMLLPLRRAVRGVLCLLLLGLVCLPVSSYALFSTLKSSCDDINGDGVPDATVLDSKGRRYCLELKTAATIFDSASTISILAYHQDGLSRVELIKDFNYPGKVTVQCDGSAWCTHELPVSLAYAGTLSLTANLFVSSGAFAASTTKNLNFTCSADVCPGDPREKNFVRWMRAKGYPECIVERYVSWYRSPTARQWLLPFLEERSPEDRLSAKQVIHLYDVIPTDIGTTFTSLAEGAAPLCSPSFAAPTFCRIRRPADYHFLETQLEETFGVDFELVYHQLPINYAETFGTPRLGQKGLQKKYIYGSRRPFLAAQKFEAHSIIHYAIDRYQGELIGDMTGASSVAEIGVHPTSIAGLRVYSHELGHTFGLPHPFTQNPYRQFQIDGIMSNTYGYDSVMRDPTDPLERYALEPRDGVYLDDAIFADTYSQAVIGARGLAQCRGVDLGLQRLAAITNGTNLQFLIQVTNSGRGRVVDVPLNIMLDNTKVPFASLSIDSIDPHTTITKLIDIPRERLYNTQIAVQIDSEKTIAEDNPVNNFRTMNFMVSGGVSLGPVKIRKKRTHRVSRQ